ncbi:hypothetical protein BSL78_25228 [Apostichopus japonicus]|uniref:Uncharacterized protein n=1 Tax=Stichopus japonicus TaxID=307972 RepID=A0A2G8JQF6_STIJA|nr:hypothetical protein BSL78_25228 [Apostichopus japonicus]
MASRDLFTIYFKFVFQISANDALVGQEGDTAVAGVEVAAGIELDTEVTVEIAAGVEIVASAGKGNKARIVDLDQSKKQLFVFEATLSMKLCMDQ